MIFAQAGCLSNPDKTKMRPGLVNTQANCHENSPGIFYDYTQHKNLKQ